MNWDETAMARAKGKGNIYKKSSGVYYLRFSINKQKKVVSLQTKNKVEAEKKAKEYLAPLAATNEAEAAEHIAKAKGLISSERTPLQNAWLTYFNSSKRLDSGPHTLKSYECYLRKFIDFIEANHKQISYIDEITPKVAELFLANLDLSPTTYNKYKNFLNLYFKTVGRDCGVHTNPFQDIPTKRQNKESWRELSEEEIQAVLSLPQSEEWALFNIGIFTGMRLKDSAKLKWADVNLAQEKIIFMPSKTSRNNKVVHIPILSDLKKVFTWLESHKKCNTYVLPSFAALYDKSRYSLSRSIQASFKKLNIVDGKVGFHSLRHTFVSECAKRGVPLSIVQAMVGHGSPAMTRHYTHIDIESARKWLEPNIKKSSDLESLNKLLAQLQGEEAIKEQIRTLVKSTRHQ